MSSNTGKKRYSEYQPSILKHNAQYLSSQQTMMMMRQQQQHDHDESSLPRSVSADDDDDDDYIKGDKENLTTQHATSSYKNRTTKNDIRQKVSTSSSSTTIVENYLLRYERMVQQQEIEEKSVMAHLLPCIQRLIELINNDTNNDSTSSNTTRTQPNSIQLHHEISYRQLYQAYQQLEHKKANPSKSTTNNSSNMTITAMECMTTDRQLMMVLRTVTQSVEDTTTTTDSNCIDHSTLRYDDTTLMGAPPYSITWAEFIQCYKVCIYSMMTLQHLPKDSMARLRARDRSLSMLALFVPTSSSITTTLLSSDFFMIPPMNQQPTGNHPSGLKSIQEKMINSPTNPSSSTSQPRRRPWFKKRTKRILRYGMLALLVVVASWYLCVAMLKWKPLAQYQQQNDWSMTCQDSTDTIKSNMATAPTFPPKSSTGSFVIQSPTTLTYTAHQEKRVPNSSPDNTKAQKLSKSFGTVPSSNNDIHTTRDNNPFFGVWAYL